MSGSSAAEPADTPERRGGPPVWFALAGIGGLVLAALIIAAQVLGLGAGGPAPAATIAPAGPAAQRTHDLVATTLEAASFQVRDPLTTYRPGESPSLIGVPRRLLQAVLPSDPNGGYIVIYELPSAADADRIGRDFAVYLASGTGAVQYPRDAQFVLRQVDRTLVFFAWSPSVSPDPSVARLAATLETVGTAIGS
jgi:hypothetical protein